MNRLTNTQARILLVVHRTAQEQLEQALFQEEVVKHDQVLPMVVHGHMDRGVQTFSVLKARHA